MLPLRAMTLHLQQFPFQVLIAITILGRSCLVLAACRDQLATCRSPLGFDPLQPISELIPNIPDNDKELFCKNFREAQQCYFDAKSNHCEGSDARLAAIAGYGYICTPGKGGAHYSLYRECLVKATAELAACATNDLSLGSIHNEGLDNNPEKHTEVCSNIHQYLTCSKKSVVTMCNDEQDAGDWYEVFIKRSFKKILGDSIPCSLADNETKEGFKVMTIAIGVGVSVGVIIILICLCWCCRAGVCTCCRENEDDFDDFPDDNDNKKAVLKKKESSVV